MATSHHTVKFTGEINGLIQPGDHFFASSLTANPSDEGNDVYEQRNYNPFFESSSIYVEDTQNDILYVGEIVDVNRTFNIITVDIPTEGSSPVSTRLNAGVSAGNYGFVWKELMVEASGILGYYMEATLETSATTKKELFQISTNVQMSSK